MKRARENSGRPAAADAATVAADTVVAGKVASEEATNNFANKGSRGQMGRAGFEPAKA